MNKAVSLWIKQTVVLLALVGCLCLTDIAHAHEKPKSPEQVHEDRVTKLTNAILSVRGWGDTHYSEADWQRLFIVAKLLQNSDPRLVSEAVTRVNSKDLFGDYSRFLLLFSTMFDLPEKVPLAGPAPSVIWQMEGSQFSDNGKYMSEAWPITWRGRMPKILDRNGGWSGQGYNANGAYNDYRKRYKYRPLGCYLNPPPLTPSQIIHDAELSALTNAVLSIPDWRGTSYSEADWQRLFTVAKLLQTSDPRLVSEVFADCEANQYEAGYDIPKLMLLFSVMFDLPEKAPVTQTLPLHISPSYEDLYTHEGKYRNLAWPLTWTGLKPRIVCSLPYISVPYPSQSVYGTLRTHYKYRPLGRYITKKPSGRKSQR